MNKAQDSLGTVATGLKLSRTISVGEDRVITFMGDELRVYETPSMIADVEYACRDLLFEHLPQGWDSVGVLVNMEHLAPTPLGHDVVIVVEIQLIHKRRVSFECEVFDRLELVGSGRHDRAIISVDRHRPRVLDKGSKLKALQS